MGKPRQRLSALQSSARRAAWSASPHRWVHRDGCASPASYRGAPLRIPVDYLHGRQPPSGVLL